MVGTSIPNRAALEKARDSALAGALRGEDLRVVLTDLVLAVEAQSSDGLIASVLLLDETGKRLGHGAAPSLPAEYNQAIDGLEIGPAAGSCGTAAFYDEAVFVSDIRRDPLWAEFAPVADAHGLRACWSIPLHGADGKVVGTFANYYRTPRLPKTHEVAAITFLAGAVAEVIARSRALT